MQRLLLHLTTLIKVNFVSVVVDCFQIAINVEEKVSSLNERFMELEEQAKQFSMHEKILQVSPLDRSDLVKFKANFESLFNLWTTAADWQITMADMLVSQFATLNAEKLNDYISACNKIVSKAMKQVAHSPGPLAVANVLKKKVDDMKKNVALITKLRHPGVRTRHWEMILKRIKPQLPIPTDEEFTLGFVLQLHLEDHSEVIINITDFARYLECCTIFTSVFP